MGEILNALEFKNAIISASNNILKHRNHINELNVFPVPDGDTGTNMCMTISGVADKLLSENFEKVSDVAEIVSRFALRCSRGNSGVILSLILRGFSKKLEDKEVIEPIDFVESLEVGVRDAYSSVSNPVEGTMLTVARVASEFGRRAYNEGKDFLTILDQICKGAREALASTPDLLPVLKRAHVVDAGGKGLCLVFEGMLSFFKDGVIVSSDINSLSFEDDSKFESETKKYDDDIRFTYCTEFIVEKSVSCDFDPEVLRKNLQKIGDCVIVMHDEEVIKTHVHTNFPDKVLNNALLYGKLLNIKVDNLEEQNKSLVKNLSIETDKTEILAPKKEAGILSIACGEGIIKLFKDLGCDEILEGGQSLNPSAEQIANAAMKVPAKVVYVLPNNKNIIMSANQASEYVTDRDIVVIPSKTIPQGIAASLSFDRDASFGQNLNNMKEGMARVSSGCVTYAARDSEFGGFEIKKGDFISLLEGKLKVVDHNNKLKAAEKLIMMMCDKTTRFLTLIFGVDITIDECESLKEIIQSKFSDIEISIIDGGSSIYYFIISAE